MTQDEIWNFSSLADLHRVGEAAALSDRVERVLAPLRDTGFLLDSFPFFEPDGSHLDLGSIPAVTVTDWPVAASVAGRGFTATIMGLDFSAHEARSLAFAMEMSLPDARQRLGEAYGMGPMRTACYGTPAHDGTMELSFDLTGFDGAAISRAFGFHWPTAAERAAQRVEAALRAQIAEIAPTPSTGLLGVMRAAEITENICTWVQKPVDVSELAGHNNNTGAAFHPPGARNSTNVHHRISDHPSRPVRRSRDRGSR